MLSGLCLCLCFQDLWICFQFLIYFLSYLCLCYYVSSLAMSQDVVTSQFSRILVCIDLRFPIYIWFSFIVITIICKIQAVFSVHLLSHSYHLLSSLSACRYFLSMHGKDERREDGQCSNHYHFRSRTFEELES